MILNNAFLHVFKASVLGDGNLNKLIPFVLLEESHCITEHFAPGIASKSKVYVEANFYFYAKLKLTNLNEPNIIFNENILD